MGKIFILSAPAGTGKTSLVARVVTEMPDFVESISWTTRKPRTGEKKGEHYHFVTEEEFAASLAGGEFLEHVELYGNRYGTSRQWIEQQLAEGKHVILVIDTQGALQLFGQMTVTSIFIQPPSLEELEKRLKGRGKDTEEAIATRLAVAKEEMILAHHYDHILVNDQFEEALAALKAFLKKETEEKT
ncbi:MAG: guanylate kinase [Chlamydiia bacterium]|nr:guanylate kinase [Chlamydiia bacterium]